MRHGDSGAETAAALAAVLHPTFLRKLDRLRLSIRRTLGTRPGHTPMAGATRQSGIEVENYRAYAAGDDLRHLDWNAYGRLDQLLIKLFRAEREVPLHVFVDLSASMTEPAADRKLSFALALAACLAYISVRNHDPVRIVGLSSEWPDRHLVSPVFNHVAWLGRLRDFLTSLAAHGDTALHDGIGATVRARRLTGAAVLLSDFLVEPAAYERALDYLVTRRLTVTAVRVIGPAERDPTRQFRRAQLLDAETGRVRFVTLSPANVARYAEALDHHLTGLQTFCRQRGVFFTVADTAGSLEESLFRAFPASGALR
jgi:uncharacterized protein (DUF58 family)